MRKYIKTSTKHQLSSRLKKPYVSIHPGTKVQIDADKLMLEKQWDGFFALQTNLKKSNPAQLLSTYRGLWQVEQTFRIAKSSLEIRPVFHYSPARIKAHFLICYMSLAAIRYVNQAGLHYTHDQFYRLLEQVKVTNILHTDKNLYTLLQDRPKEINSIYAALNITNPKKFSYQSTA